LERPRVLLVDGDPAAKRLVQESLEARGYEVEAVVGGITALQALSSAIYVVVLVDLESPDLRGLGLLAAGPGLQPDAQFVVVTDRGSIDTAVEAMRLGAFDYLCKPIHVSELVLTVDRASTERNRLRELAQLRHEARAKSATPLIGSAPAFQRTLDLVKRVAVTNSSVLITGETGTGKELVATEIHRLSDRATRPFVAVNCSAIPESLLESELFGHMKGSFTGAIATRSGLVEAATGGTLFLDEAASLSPSVQVKLLRTLQERTIQRVGAPTPIPVDFRLVASSNVDLAGEVKAGRFRQDLYYRLNVFPIRIPPLRERRGDIPLLAAHFRNLVADANGIPVGELTSSTVRRLQEYHWPGNVRELASLIERAVIMHRGAATLPISLPNDAEPALSREQIGVARQERWALARLEREYILQVLDDVDWQYGRAAEILGIDRRTLRRKLVGYNREGHWAGRRRKVAIPPPLGAADRRKQFTLETSPGATR
jgi:DNA-binding NtrC family response regulator